MLIFLLLLAATAVSCENHTINVNDPLNEFVFTNVFPNLHADQRQSNFAALTQAMSMLDLSFASYTQVAAFLGTVAFNTDDLNRHEARCAQDNSCDLALYDTTCNPGNSSINGNHFYPRSAMMISFQCGYAHVDSILRNYSALAGIPSLTENPYLLSTNLLFSYLASLAVWADPDSNGESCMSLTATNMTGLPSCISKMNPWECSLAGQQDQARHLQSISKAAQALGINMALDDLTPISCSNVSVVNSPAPTALPEDDCTGPWADDNSSLPIVLPGNSSTACGIISQQMFAAAFSQLSNDSNTVDIHFQSLSSACEFASIDRLDVRQASFLLGSMMLNMMNVSDAGNASDTYHGRGLMMISGLASYQRLSIYLRQLGINYDVVSDPDIVSSNLVISYLSVFMTMEQTNCMQSISSGQFGSCIARIPRHDKLCQSGSAQDRLVAAVEASSRILGQPISPSLLRTSLCNGTSTEDDDDVSNAPATSVSIIAILSLAAVSLLL